MRYILYLFTLALVFVGGMLVGNIYLPERNSSMAAAISVPDAQSAHPAIAAATLDAAQRNLRILNEALNSCPVVVGEEKERLIHQIDLFWARQDFDIKKARYELEIAKNTPGTAVTSRFAQASADYAAALKRVEKMAQEFFPQPQEEKAAAQPAKPAEPSAKNITPAKTAAPKQAAEKTPVKTETKTEPAPATPEKPKTKTEAPAVAAEPQAAAETSAGHTQAPSTAQPNEPAAQKITPAETTQTTAATPAEADAAVPPAQKAAETPAETSAGKMPDSAATREENPTAPATQAAGQGN